MSLFTMAAGSDLDGPSGYSYAAVLLRADESTRDRTVQTLRRIRFNGWVGPVRDGWLVLVPAGVGTVASGRRGVVGVAEALVEDGARATLAVRVLDDRQLAVVGWSAEEEVVRYVSDPSREPGAALDVLEDPYGVEGAEALAELCGRPDEGEALLDLLAEPLDPDEEIESERLARLLSMLGLPSWVVSTWRLPRPMAAGPSSAELLRLGAGRPGATGWLAGRVVDRARRLRRPLPVLADPPRDDGEQGGLDDETAMWL